MRKNITIIGILFFVFGFVTWVNAILIPYFKIACELSNFQSYLVAFAFYISYLLISVPASYLLRNIGFKKGMMTGFFIMAAGAFTFIIASLWRSYVGFLGGLFAIGSGLAILQTAANPYITILGARERAAQRISIMGICNKGAGILAPILFAAVILRPTDAAFFKSLPGMDAVTRAAELDGLIRRVIMPYSIVGVVLAGLGCLVRFSGLPEIGAEEEGHVEAVHSDKTSIFQFPHLVLGALAIFLHVGTQVLAVDTIIGYAGSMNIILPAAKIFPSYVLMATIAGYLIGIVLIPKYISQAKALLVCTILGMVFSLLVVFNEGRVSLGWLVSLGFANSLIWAGIWPLALDGLGRFTKLGASLLVMGLCGNAILPLIYGALADRWNVRDAYWVLVPCYAYLFFYAVYGHRIRNWFKFKSGAIA